MTQLCKKMSHLSEEPLHLSNRLTHSLKRTKNRHIFATVTNYRRRMQAKRHISADTNPGTKIFRKMRLRVAAEGIFPYLRPVCWRCSPSLWQLGKNRFIRMAASAAPHERGRRFRQGWRNVRLAGSPTRQALQESVIGAAPCPIREITEVTTLIQ